MAGKSDSDQRGASLLVAMNLYGLDPDERRKAAEIVFRHAGRAGIDSIIVKPGWMETPPKDLAAAVSIWLKTGKRPYITAVNLFTDAQEVVGVSDAEDLSLQINRADWDRLRPEFEGLLGSIRIEAEDLAG